MKTLQALIIVAVFLTANQLSAQFTVGIKGGYTVAWPDYGDVVLPEDAETQVNGLNASLIAYYRINDNLHVGVEPGFINRGAACVPGWQPIFVGDTKLLLNYVELPLMISGNHSFIDDKFEVFGKFGYGVSMITAAFREQTDDRGRDILPVPPLPDSRLVDIDSLNRFDHGLYGSAGLGYNFGVNQVFLETAYYHGMEDVDKFNTSKNRSLNISLGYLVKF